MPIRNIIAIDQERCDGCGLCVPDCAEGAIAIIDGKAKLVKDSYCDGLGACLGACPRDALRIIQREADEFDEAAAMGHVRNQTAPPSPLHPGTCPSSAARVFDMPAFSQTLAGVGPGTWPLKISLVPPTAPFLRNAHLLVAADCAAAASPLFHTHIAAEKVVIIGCPKLEPTSAHVEKLLQILNTSGIASLTVLRIEVPCCRGLSMAVQTAMRQSNNTMDISEHIMSCSGHIIKAPGVSSERLIP